MALDMPPGTRHAVCITVCCPQILTSTTQAQSRICSQQQKLPPQVHPSWARGGDKLTQSFLEQKGKSVAPLQNSGGKRQTTSPGWVIKRENNAELQGSWHSSPTRCSPRDGGPDLGPTEVSPTARPWPDQSPVLNRPSENLTSPNYLLTNWRI